MATNLRLTWDERKEKVSDILAFLAAFGVSRNDAQSILSMAYGEIKEMSAEQFIRKGKDMELFMLAMRNNQSGKPS